MDVGKISNELLMLKSEKKIERERAFYNIKKLVENNGNDEIITYINKELDSITMNDDWKRFYSILNCIKLIIKKNIDEELIKKYCEFSLLMLEQVEARVRDEASDVIGIFGTLCSEYVYKMVIEKIFILINRNLLLDDISNEEIDSDEKAKLNAISKWIYIESGMKALKSFIFGYGTKFMENCDILIIEILLKCSKHSNRFVREICMNLFGTLIDIGLIEHFKDLVPKISSSLLLGLNDNWSQVRFAASVATRSFLLKIDKTMKDQIYDTLLPAVRLNRHYLAEGVKLYNIETWTIISQGLGEKLVGENIENYLKFYVNQAQADNHAVREAACHCLAEIGFILSEYLTENHLDYIYENLILFSRDESWPVRDTSCFALSIIVSYNSKYFETKLYNILEIFKRNIFDYVPSVRTTAALAFCRVINSLPDNTCVYVQKLLEEKLDNVKDQKEDIEKYQNKKVLNYSAMKELYDNDIEIHSNQVMYSCCSLSPKMKKDQQNCASSSCNDHSFNRISQPWEISDGCISLIGEMCNFFTEDNKQEDMVNKIVINKNAKIKVKNIVISILPTLARTLEYKSFALYHNMLYTFLKYFPFIINFIGFDEFKHSSYYQLFSHHLRYASSQHSDDNVMLAATNILGQFQFR